MINIILPFIASCDHYHTTNIHHQLFLIYSPPTKVSIMLNFKVYSNGLSSMITGNSPYDVAKTIAAKLNSTEPEYIGDSIYTIGGLKFHFTYIP